MRTPEERRAQVYLLASKRKMEKSKRTKAVCYCFASIAIICSALMLLHYITNENIISTKEISGFHNSPIESIELNGNDISKTVTDRTTVTQISICVKGMIEGCYIAGDNLTTVYTVTFVHKDNIKSVYQFTEDCIIVGERCYPIQEEDLNKLLNYFK